LAKRIYGINKYDDDDNDDEDEYKCEGHGRRRQ
jgi:hypothetical protein